MNFGKLDRRITLRKLVNTVHATSGESVREVEREIKVWAQYRGARNNRESEQFEAGREISKGLAQFLIRYRDGIDGSLWEIEDWLGRIWDFMGEPEIVGRREALSITAELRV